eukprot:730543-Prymnesium_polylepis.1
MSCGPPPKVGPIALGQSSGVCSLSEARGGAANSGCRNSGWLVLRTLIFFLRASSLMMPVGSEPMESSVIIGTKAVVSSDSARRSSGFESTNRLPSADATYL